MAGKTCTHYLLQHGYMVPILWIDGMRKTLTKWFSGVPHLAKCTVFDLKGGVDLTMQLWGF